MFSGAGVVGYRVRYIRLTLSQVEQMGWLEVVWLKLGAKVGQTYQPLPTLCRINHLE